MYIKRVLGFIVFSFVFTSIQLHQAVGQSTSDLEYNPGELIVRFAPKPNFQQRTKSEQNTILASINGGIVKRTYKLVPGLSLVKLPAPRTVKNSLADFRRLPGILYVEPNYKIRLYSTEPNDSSFDYLWGMHNTGQTGGTFDADIDAPEAWDIRTDANDIIVAVIDTGVDYNHFDLAENIWINTDEEPNDANNDGRPGISGFDDDVDNLIDEDSNGREPGDPNWTNDLFEDDDENGYVDDFYGYDFSGYTPADQDNDPMDEYGHGTHVAGTIGAFGNNGIGVTGVCWNVKIMALKIMPPYSGGLEAFVNNAIEAIEYATNNSAQVMNAS